MTSRSGLVPTERLNGVCAPIVGKRRPRTAIFSKRVALFPILFFEVYLTLSVLTFAFGPWSWPVSNPLELYGFLALAQLALFLGYRSAIFKPQQASSTSWRVPRMIAVSLLLNLAWLPQQYKTRTSASFSFGTALDAVAQGIVNPSTQYLQRFKNVADGMGSTPLDYLGLLLSPAVWILFPLAVVHWHRLSTLLKIGFVIWVICDLLTWIAAGTNKGLADFLMLLPWLLIARNPLVLAVVPWRKVLTMGLVLVIGCSAFLVFFTGRWGGHGVSLTNPESGATVETEHSYFALLPEALHGTLVGTTSYFTQGYYALGLSLQEPFVFCYGIGNSFFWEGLSRKFVDTPILDRTYPGRIRDQGWDPHGRWHTFYPWIASDVSFYGTIVVMFLVGRLFALVWRDVVLNRSPWAICLFPLLLMMLYYIPANNQVLAFPGTALPFWTLLFVWLYSRAAGRRTPRRAV